MHYVEFGKENNNIILLLHGGGLSWWNYEDVAKSLQKDYHVILPTIGYFHPIQTYYFGKLLDRESTPTETDHILCWIEYEQLKGKMLLEMQNWALEQLSAYME